MMVNMDKEGFEIYLQRGGRSPNAVKRCIKYVSTFEDYLRVSRQGTQLDDVKPDELIGFLKSLDKDAETKSKGYLWAIRYYYDFTDDPEICKLAGMLREEMMERKPFSLKEFRGVDRDCVDALAENGIRNVDQMLAAGATNVDRVALAELTGIPLPSILEFVKLSDLTRIPGVKGIRARLYYEAGIDTIEKMADHEPEELHAQVAAYVNSSNFNGIATLPVEAIYTVEKARELPKIVEY